jgi:hypothetical protein
MTQTTIGEAVWTISRQAPIGIGARAEGDRLPVAPDSGLWLHSNKGEGLFCPVPYDELPSRDQLADIPMAQIAAMMTAARANKKSNS